MIIVRFEREEDRVAIRRINEAAFGRPDEAILVDTLREDANPVISLVAEFDRQLVGHIFFSPVSIEPEVRRLAALALGPLAVLPEFQNQGIGSVLVRQALAECRKLKHDAVVVLGHPKYYPRFGFMTASTKGLRCEYPVPDENFMVTELTPGALIGTQGLVKYHLAFECL